MPEDPVSYTSGDAPPVPEGLEAIKRTFGDCLSPDWAKRSLVTFDLPYHLIYGTAMVRRATAHKLLVPVFQAVLADIKYRGLTERATHYGGIYNHRIMRGASTQRLSTHSWGIAIDLNPETNRLGTPGTMDPGVIECFERHGFVWGGRFHRLDPMHFQYARGY